MAELRQLTFNVGMGGESEKLSFVEMISAIGYLHHVLDHSAEILRTGVIADKPYDIRSDPSDEEIVGILRRTKLTYSQPV